MQIKATCNTPKFPHLTKTIQIIWNIKLQYGVIQSNKYFNKNPVNNVFKYMCFVQYGK